MQLEDYLDFETTPVEHIRLKGTRIDIDFVIELHKRHMTPEQIAVHFAYPLELVQVYAAITYYLQNQAEMDAYLDRRERIGTANILASLQQPPSEALKRIKAYKTAHAQRPAESP